MADITAIACEEVFPDGSQRLKVEYDARAKEFAGKVLIHEVMGFITIDPKDLGWLIEALQQVQTVVGRLSQHKED